MALPKRVQKLIETLLGRAGKSLPELRRAVFEQTSAAPSQRSAFPPGQIELCELVEKIDQRPWTVDNTDFPRLRQAGYSEDEIFELTVAAAVGAGVRRLEAGLRALESAEREVAGAY